MSESHRRKDKRTESSDRLFCLLPLRRLQDNLSLCPCWGFHIRAAFLPLGGSVVHGFCVHPVSSAFTYFLTGNPSSWRVA